MLNSKSKVNAIYSNFANKLGFSIRPTDVETQKIDGTMLDTYKMVVVVFLVIDKANQVRFFEKIFLVLNVSLKVVLGMVFLTLSNSDVNFLEKKFQ